MKKLRTLLAEELSGENAVKHTDRITQFYRTAGSTGIHEATEFCRVTLEKGNLDEVTIETYPVDGATSLMGRASYPLWEPRDVELEIVEPVQEGVVTYTDAPTCIMWFSTPTPPEGVVAELVDVGAGIDVSDYEGKDIEGKIAFASGGGLNPGVRMYELAVERFGAIGVVTDFLLGEIPGIRTRETMPEFVGLLRQPRTFDKAWSIVISGSKGDRLRALLREGPVKLWAKVDTIVSVGTGENLVAAIRGSEKPHEEVVLIGHTSATKPGGNCASGPALMNEIACTLQRLINEGRLPRPRRTIRFLYGCEGLGSNAYLKDHWDERANMMAGLCLCGVGEDQEKCKSSLLLSRTPDAVPSFLNELTLMIQSEVCGGKLLASGPMRYGVEPYSPFSDNMSFNLADVPCILLHSSPNKYFHTQYMTADKMDPEVFEAAGLILAEAAYRIADADHVDAIQWANLVEENGEAYLSKVASKTFDGVVDESRSGESAGPWNNELVHLLDRDLKAIDSVKALVPDEALTRVIDFTETSKAALIEKYVKETKKIASITPETDHDQTKADGWKPQKVEKVFPTGHYYPNLDLTYEEWMRIGEKMKAIEPRFQQGKIRSIIHEIFNYADGELTLHEIIEKIGFENGLKLDAGLFAPIMEALVKYGTIKPE